MDSAETTPRTPGGVSATDTTLRFYTVLRKLAWQNRRNDVDRIYAGGLTWAQSSLLHAILTYGRIRLHELASLERISRPSMTIAVGRLQKRGLVHLIRDSRDRRGKWVEITAAGIAVHRHSNAAIDAALVARLAVLSAQDREALALATPILQRLADSHADSGQHS